MYHSSEVNNLYYNRNRVVINSLKNYYLKYAHKSFLCCAISQVKLTFSDSVRHGYHGDWTHTCTEMCLENYNNISLDISNGFSRIFSSSNAFLSVHYAIWKYDWPNVTWYAVNNVLTNLTTVIQFTRPPLWCHHVTRIWKCDRLNVT